MRAATPATMSIYRNTTSIGQSLLALLRGANATPEYLRRIVSASEAGTLSARLGDEAVAELAARGLN